jgi:MFS family permease
VGFRRSDHPVRSFQRRLREIFLMSRPPLLCEEGNIARLQFIHSFYGRRYSIKDIERRNRMYQLENAGDLLTNDRNLRGLRTSGINVGTTVFLLGITSLLTDVSSEMVSTTLPLYLLVTLAFSPFQVGVMDGIYQGAAVLVNVISGLVADRWRRPKEVAATGYGFSAICKLGFLIVGSTWTGISGVILLDRIGKGIRTAPRDAMIAASSPSGQLATAFGVHRAMDTAGAMIGPLVAVAILSVAPGAYDAIFVVSLCVAVIGLAVIVLFVDNPQDRVIDNWQSRPTDVSSANAKAVSLRSIGVLLSYGEFRSLIIVGSALALVTVSDSLLYLGLQQRMTIPNGLFPLLYVVTALIFMVFAVPAGWLADRVGHKQVFILGYGLLAGVYSMLLSPRMSYLTAVLTLILLGSFYAATDGVLMALASRALPAHLRSTGLALLTTGTGLGRLLASTLYGTVWSWLGAERALMIFSGGLVAMLLLAWRTIQRVEQN